ncbi:ABC transporter permease subunit [Hydrotalea sandarakina]|uniref:ABC-2 type transport system permease protein n=1 Tax=Hydrotalea sandarakina TaxID=1004304 RepID=A0A2W7SNN0_9BACT|nr:ABC transporter permease [Hydrotalea sandarakina]PZX64575.1 ABC-2 type transport system permease protein [Hydrotalea sandarakina]
MWMICKKEWNQFFSSITAYVALIIFLLLNGLFLFVFPDSSMLNFGYATLTPFFDFVPWVLLFLIPTITMRSLADEYKSGTFELLKTWPIKPAALVFGKFLGAFLIIIAALIPTLVYAFSLQHLSSSGGLDIGATIGSYIGLLLLSGAFISIGLAASSFTNNTVVAFIAGAFVCFMLYIGFDALSKLPIFSGTLDYYIEMLGINFHYQSVSRGVIDTRDLVYFFVIIFFFLFITQKNIIQR